MRTLSDEVPREPGPLEAERRGRQSPSNSTLQAPGSIVWAAALAIALWGLGSLALAIGIGFLLALARVNAVTDEVATALGLVDLVLLIPAVYVGMRAERLTDRRALVLVAIGSASVATLASVFANSVVLIILGSAGLFVARAVRQWLSRRSLARGEPPADSGSRS